MRLGLAHQRRSGGKAALSLGGGSLEQTVDGGSSETDARLGVGLSYALAASADLDLGLGYSMGRRNASGVSGAIALRIGF